MAQALLLVAQSFVLSGSIAEDVPELALRIELAGSSRRSSRRSGRRRQAIALRT